MNAYLIWFQYYQKLLKTHRYSLGLRIDLVLIEAIEAIATAHFLLPKEKLPFVRRAIQKVDTAKILLLMLTEAKSLKDAEYIAISEKLFPVGKMLGGWQSQLIKQNTPDAKPGVK